MASPFLFLTTLQPPSGRKVFVLSLHLVYSLLYIKTLGIRFPLTSWRNEVLKVYFWEHGLGGRRNNTTTLSPGGTSSSASPGSSHTHKAVTSPGRWAGPPAAAGASRPIAAWRSSGLAAGTSGISLGRVCSAPAFAGIAGAAAAMWVALGRSRCFSRTGSEAAVWGGSGAATAGAGSRRLSPEVGGGGDIAVPGLIRGRPQCRGLHGSPVACGNKNLLKKFASKTK